MLTKAEPLADVSAWLVAVTVTPAGDGIICGAAYMPVAEIVPTLELPPAIPLTLQETPVFDVPVTLAANCCVCPRITEAVEGVTLTVTFGGGGGGGGGEGAEVVPAQPASDTSKISATPKHTAVGRTCRLGLFISIALVSVEVSFTYLCCAISMPRTDCAKPVHSLVSREAAKAWPDGDTEELS